MDKLTVITEKRCTKCGVVKPRNEMRSLSTAKDGMYPSCKECHNRDSREYKRANREKMTQSARDYRNKMRENDLPRLRELERKARISRKEYIKQYYINNKPAERAKRKDYYAANKDKWVKYGRTYSRNNPDKIAENNHKRRAGRKTGEHYTAEQWKQLCDDCGNKCLCCGDETKLTIDHIVPISKGGTNHISNIQPLCYPCNRKKWTQIIDYRG